MTTELDPERIRLRAFYLSLTRTWPGDPDRDWIEAEAAERAAMEEASRPTEPLPIEPPSLIEEATPIGDSPVKPEPEPEPEPAPEPEPVAPALTPEIVLKRYPHVEAAFARGGAERHVEASYLGTLLQKVIDGHEDLALQNAEHSLEVLLARFKPTELAGLSGALVDTSDPVQSEVSWELAQAELAVLALLQSKGLLHSLGWRRPAAFQCCLGNKKFGLALDIKPALGGGLASVHDAVASAATELGHAKGLGALDAALWYRGRAVAKPGGATATAQLESFTTAVKAQETRPANPVPLQLGNALFDVTLGERAEGGASTLPNQLLPVFKKYLEARAYEASGEEDASFLLVNVLLPSSSAISTAANAQLLEGLAKRAASGAATLANSVGSLWLGMLELDLRGREAKHSLLIRPAANWPLSHRELAGSLDATVAVL